MSHNKVAAFPALEAVKGLATRAAAATTHASHAVAPLVSRLTDAAAVGGTSGMASTAMGEGIKGVGSLLRRQGAKQMAAGGVNVAKAARPGAIPRPASLPRPSSWLHHAGRVIEGAGEMSKAARVRNAAFLDELRQIHTGAA